MLRMKRDSRQKQEGKWIEEIRKGKVGMNEPREECYERADYTGFAFVGYFRPRLNRKYTRS